MDNVLLLYNNEVANNTWEHTKAKPVKAVQKTVAKSEDNFISLLVNKFDDLEKKIPENSENDDERNNQSRNGRRTFPAWRYEHPDNLTEMTNNNGVTFKWCTNDFHDKPMWCSRKNCRGKVEWAEHL